MIIFKFEPLYQERPWGGNTIAKNFNRENIHKCNNIGESWEIVDRPEAQSIVSEGPSIGNSLRELILKNCYSIMGPNWDQNARFPILVKWLDCKERLSLQVHPPKNIANELGGEPKTENWYIADASNDSGLFIGLKKCTKKEFELSLREGNTESLCHRMNSSIGDSILVKSGTIHAIDAGNLILEIQQNSDTTYRVYDWGRLGLNGEPRKLHIEDSLKSINFNDIKPNVIKSDNTLKSLTLANCKNFRLIKYNLNKGSKLIYKDKDNDCILLHLISGKITIGDSTLYAGEQALSPYNCGCEIISDENSTLLITDRFTNCENLKLALSN